MIDVWQASQSREYGEGIAMQRGSPERPLSREKRDAHAPGRRGNSCSSGARKPLRGSVKTCEEPVSKIQ
jgi:hypothetical protein